MKTVVEKATNLSKYIFSDDVELVMYNEMMLTPTFIVSDLNNTNAIIYEDVSPPEDWQGNRYAFNGTTWAANADWVDPDTVEEGDE